MFVESKQSNQAGLTLIELLVVIALIAILAGVAAPNLSAWNCRQNTVKDFTDLASAIIYLQGLAIDQNRSIRLEASGTGSTVIYTYYQSKDVAKKTTCSGSMSPWILLTGEQIHLNGTLVSGSPRSACFHGDGSVNQEQALTWRVGQQCPDKRIDYRIKVYGSTGFMEKEKWNPLTQAWVEF